MVVGYADDMTAVALGQGRAAQPAHRRSRRRGPGGALCAGRGPRRRFAREAHLAVEARDGLPHAGDLWLISTVYPDGTVAALEELVGNHGGLGGEQTDAFIFHPADMEVPETRNATDVFHILNNHRGKPVAAPSVAAEERSPIGRRAICSKASARLESGSAPPCAAWCSTAKPTPRGQRSVHDRAGAADRPARCW
jgi:hypothetical protein